MFFPNFVVKKWRNSARKILYAHYIGKAGATRHVRKYFHI